MKKRRRKDLKIMKLLTFNRKNESTHLKREASVVVEEVSAVFFNSS